MPRPSARSVELTITGLNEHGYGVGQKAGQTLSVARTAPGDHVLTGPPESPNRWTTAPLLKVLKPGPDRVDPQCQGFTEGCGGCQWLHWAYPAQTAWKEKTLAALLRTRAGFRGTLVPLAAAVTEGYRNKLSLKNVGGRLLFVPETDESPLAPLECRVQTAALQRAWAVLRSQGVPPAVEQLHLRSNERGQVGLHAFVKDTSSSTDAALKRLFDLVPGAIGLGATTRQGYRTVAGEPSLAQTLGTTTWLVPHNGFFQTNAVQAAVLLDVVRQQARVTRADRVLDLYCGAGFFGLALAAQAREVVGIEENLQSVEAARASADTSGVRNARFLSGDLGAVLATVPTEGREMAVVDPPREGLLPRALELLIARSPQRIVYVSCYPQSLVRDLKALAAAGWRAVSCTPVDMFPHTTHLEAVVTLER